MSGHEEASQRERPGYERVGRLLYGLQRSCGGVEGLRGLQTDNRVDASIRQRGAALADRYAMLYGRLARDPAAVDDADVDEFLAEARALDDEVSAQCGRGWMWSGD